MPDIHYWEKGDLGTDLGNGLFDIVIPENQLEEILHKAHHESGHALAAHLLRAEMKGIVLQYRPTQTQLGWRPAAMWHATRISPQDEAMVLAAGAASEQIFAGSYDPISVSGDRAYFETLAGRGDKPFEYFIEDGVKLLLPHKLKIDVIAQAISHAIKRDAGLETGVGQPQSEWRHVEQLTSDTRGVYLLTEHQIKNLLRPQQFQYQGKRWEIFEVGNEWRGICSANQAVLSASTKQQLHRAIKESRE